MSGNQIFNTIIEFFETDEWQFNWLEGTSMLSMGFTGKNGKWTCYAQAREDQEQLVFYSVCPINAPEDRRHQIAEFITRANYGMIIGNFELDFNDGEIRYKTSVDVEGDSLTIALVKQLVYANVIIMDRYLPGLMRVIYSDSTPAEEIEKIEGMQAAGFVPPDDVDFVANEDDAYSDTFGYLDQLLTGDVNIEDEDDDEDDEDDEPIDYNDMPITYSANDRDFDESYDDDEDEDNLDDDDLDELDDELDDDFNEDDDLDDLDHDNLDDEDDHQPKTP